MCRIFKAIKAMEWQMLEFYGKTLQLQNPGILGEETIIFVIIRVSHKKMVIVLSMTRARA
jgi:hypothetical protein